MEDAINLGKAVDVVVTAVRDPSLYRFPLEVHCVDPDLTGLLTNTKVPKDAPLTFPLNTTDADLERIAEITGREYLSPTLYARTKAGYRRYLHRGSQFPGRPRKVGKSFKQRHGMQAKMFRYPARPFRAARAPNTDRKSSKAGGGGDDEFDDEGEGEGGGGDDERSVEWEE